MQRLNDTRTGESAVVLVRLPDADLARLKRLVTRRRGRSALIRDLLRHSLDALERAEPPPDDRGG